MLDFSTVVVVVALLPTLSQWKILCLPTQDDDRMWNFYSTCLSRSSLRTWMGQVSKHQHEDACDVFEGVLSHLVLGNKYFRTGWECTFLPRFIMKVKSEWMQWTTMFICLIECFLYYFEDQTWKANNYPWFNQNFDSFKKSCFMG